tara:strand:- start:353 stop:799 length:447 start_codon:yes stop_codon:yes gene_type:complete
MAKTIDMRLSKAAVKYDIAVTERPSKVDRKEALAEADVIIEEAGSAVDVNRNAASQIDVTYLPSLHSIFSNTYTIIDSEMRHLARCSSGPGLDNLQSRHFGVLTRSLCQLAQLEMGIKEQSSYDAIPDDELKALVARAHKRLNEEGDK